MPSIGDVVDILQELENTGLHIEPAHCVKVRNRNATCSRCADACPTNAISISNNAIAVDAAECVSCGACCTVCPSDAIQFTDPSDDELADEVIKAAEKTGGTIAVMCARVASHHRADDEKVVTVPCLARIDESFLLTAACSDASSVVLIDGKCSTCKYHATDETTSTAMDEVNMLLELWGSDRRIQRTSAVPEELAVSDEELNRRRGKGRRGFFTSAGSTAKEAAKTAATVTVEKELGIDRKKDLPSIRDMLKYDDDGNMPRERVIHHEQILEELYELGDPVRDEVFPTTLWGDVYLADPAACDNCGLCATFCTTGALNKIVPEGSKKTDHLEFRLADCIQCHLCADSCFRHALAVRDEVPSSRVLELEPVEIRGTKEQSNNNMFGYVNNNR